MVKVILETPFGRKTDLFSESASLRKVLDELCADTVHTEITVNGEAVPEDALDRALMQFGANPDMRITSFPRPAGAPEEAAEDTPPAIGEEKYMALRGKMEAAREALGEAIRELDDLCAGYLPF